jgi:hypothetical protein
LDTVFWRTVVVLARKVPAEVEVEIREFSPDHAPAVRELFIRANRLLAPADMKEAFEIYIGRALREEIDRVHEYYSERKGGFWLLSMARGSLACSGWSHRPIREWSYAECMSIPICGAEGLLEQC